MSEPERAAGGVPATAAATTTARDTALADAERLLDFQHRLQQLVLNGQGMQRVLDVLSAEVQGTAFFDNTAHQLVAYAPEEAGSDPPALDRWLRHSRQPHDAKGSVACVWATVAARDEQWGRVHAFPDPCVPPQLAERLVAAAASAATLWLLTRRAPTALIDETRSALLADLWQGRQWSAEHLIARSRSLGGNLDRPVLVGVAIRIAPRERPGGERPLARAAGDSARPPGSRGAASANLGADALGGSLRTAVDGSARAAAAAGSSRLQQLAFERLEAAARHARIDSFAAVVEHTTVAILGLTREQHHADAHTATLRRTLGALTAEVDASVIVSVGLSRPGSAQQLRAMLTAAADAANHGFRVEEASGLFRSEDLGLRGLLTHLARTPQLSQFVEEQLGPLLEHDATARTPLLPTLRVFLDSAGRKTQAADALHIERRSLYYRIARIESILLVSLDDAAARLRLHVAAQGLDVLRAAPGLV